MVKENDKGEARAKAMVKWFVYGAAAVACITAVYYLFSIKRPSVQSLRQQMQNVVGGASRNTLCKEPCHGFLNLPHTTRNSDGRLMMSVEVVGLRDEKKHHFDLDVSEKIGLDRPLPDARSEACKKAQLNRYPPVAALPSTSVIFSFCNEPLTTLWRSVISVLNRTPPELLEEIILVDDGSTAPWVKKPLEDFVSGHPKIKLIRLPKQVGLMGGRQAGADIAVGKTLTFLDSHIEVTAGWYEPLAVAILEDPKQILYPVIDTIAFNTFEFSFSANSAPAIVGFRWDMFMTWRSPTKAPSDASLPIDSPAMPGGLFTVDRQWWDQLGGYDTGMSIWEERTWSWVLGLGSVDGHGYEIPSLDLQRNQLRVAKIWMDDYAKLTYGMLGQSLESYNVGNIDKMLEIKKKNQCKPFQYFLDNVFMTGWRFDLVKAGSMRNIGTGNKCLDIKGFNDDQTVQTDIIMYPCHGAGVQFIMLNTIGEIMHQGKEDFCLDSDVAGQISFYVCHDMRGNQEWLWDRVTKQIKHSSSGKCLSANDEKPFVSVCDGSRNQQWEFSLHIKDVDVTKSSIDEARRNRKA